MSFPEFVRWAIDPPENVPPLRRADPHWRPQLYVGRLVEFVDRIDFVGDFGRLGGDAEALLRRLGGWDEFGASGWGPDGADAMFAANDAVNRTGAADQMAEHYDDDLLAAVVEAYAVDYDLRERLGLSR